MGNFIKKESNHKNVCDTCHPPKTPKNSIFKNNNGKEKRARQRQLFIEKELKIIVKNENNEIIRKKF